MKKIISIIISFLILTIILNGCNSTNVVEPTPEIEIVQEPEEITTSKLELIQEPYIIKRNIDRQKYTYTDEFEDNYHEIDYIAYEAYYDIADGTYQSDVIVHVFKTIVDADTYWKNFVDESSDNSDIEFKAVEFEGKTIYHYNSPFYIDNLEDYTVGSVWKHKNVVISLNEPKTEKTVFNAYFNKYS
ncbi:hypothetical protein HOD20_07560 [archaeon]|jgi:hypothetical protein|nr:hypothetical protein [archaeon]MBT4352364.1 hypothetical protein [archaeon]MBT4646982.1 hypothetical protein [archaeon]MBT6822577.1 hypothetical protein [archaeon]MBT7392762.1 hypothetical protein [archaeon]